jgi:hypothetical protein
VAAPQPFIAIERVSKSFQTDARTTPIPVIDDISIAIDKVASGNGLETYRTVWLVEFNYVGVLVLFAAVVLALLVGGGMWLHDWWQWRSLEKKYGARRGNT